MKSQKRSKIHDVFEKFEKEEINYALLRNYDLSELDELKDIDLLVDEKDIGEVKDILDEADMLKKKWKWFPFRKIPKLFHLQLKQTSSSAFENKDVLKNREKHQGIYKLGKEEELKHLLVHCTAKKGYFKDKYKKRINYIISEVNIEQVKKDMEEYFGRTGINIVELAEKKRFEEIIENGDIINKKSFSTKYKIKRILYKLKYPILQ